LFQTEKRLAGAKGSTEGARLFDQAEPLGIEAAMRGEVADAQPDADLRDAVGSRWNQGYGIAVRIS
jgi:hypothetical protein